MPAWIAPAAQLLVGGIQTLSNAGKSRNAQNELQRMVDNYQPNRSILDFYNKALQRYNVNPYTSATYTQASERARAGTAQGIAALSDKRSTIAGLPRLIQGQNDALLNAAAVAEGQQAQALGQLGQATGMKANEDRYKFENKYNLLALKAGAASQGVNAGIQNMFGGLQNASNMGMINAMYGTPKTRRASSTSSSATTSGVGYAPDFDNYGQPG
jgi:hypothetical protein